MEATLMIKGINQPPIYSLSAIRKPNVPLLKNVKFFQDWNCCLPKTLLTKRTKKNIWHRPIMCCPLAKMPNLKQVIEVILRKPRQITPFWKKPELREILFEMTAFQIFLPTMKT